MSWPTQKLETVADFCLGKMLDQKKNRGEPLPYLANVNVRWGEFDLANLREMRFEQHELDRYGLKYGDIVMCEGGEPGRCAIWKEQCSSMMIQKALHRIRPHDCLRPEFLYYFLFYKARTGHLSSLFTGSTIKHLPREKLALVEVPVPPLSTQDQIASVLSAYDDLIENNRRRIQLLEQAARLLYKEWFVHLRFPGHEHTQIINGVPEGWEKGVVSDFYDTASGGTPSRKNPEFYGGTIRWVKTQELEDGFLFDTEEHITENAIKKSAAKLFPANAVLIAMYGATIGQVGVIVESSTCNQACCAVMPKAEGTSYEHAFLFFLNNKEGLRNLGQGAAQKNISQQVIRAYEMVLPDKLVLNMFRINAGPFLRQIRTLHAMNQKLTKARDLLLPKLMNREMAV